WLNEAEPTELTDEDAEPARPYTPEAVAVELMSDELVAELESLTAGDDETGDLPEWLNEAEITELTDEDAEPARPYAPEAVAVELMPDELVAELESLTADDDEDSNLPEWLNEAETAELTDEDAEPARPYAPEAVAAELMPDELMAELESLTASDDEAGDLPEWLSEAEITALTDEDAEPARPYAPEAIAVELMPDELVAELESLTAGDEESEDWPEWLRDFDVESIEARLSEEDAEPARPFTPEAEEFSATLLPDALVAELAALTAGEDDEDQADLPEWLQELNL